MKFLKDLENNLLKDTHQSHDLINVANIIIVITRGYFKLTTHGITNHIQCIK